MSCEPRARRVCITAHPDPPKVTLHATAAVQNLTYKNTACCQSVLEHGGEKALKKLLHHKSEDVQQVRQPRAWRALVSELVSYGAGRQTTSA